MRIFEFSSDQRDLQTLDNPDHTWPYFDQGTLSGKRDIVMPGSATTKHAARAAGLAVYIPGLPGCHALAPTLSLQSKRSRLTYDLSRF
jgi:hypothetical protein